MLDGIYRLTLTNKFGTIDRFPAALTQGELTAWNANFSLSGTVNYYNSEIYIRKSTKSQISGSVISDAEAYTLLGLTTIHQEGFSVVESEGLQLVLVAIKEDNYIHV